MEIAVCIKQVPAAGEARFDPTTRRLDRTTAAAVINPFDRRAIALAVDLGARFGGTTTALTLGPPPARAALEEALASGIDRAIHLCDPAFAGSDTLATARALAAALRRLRIDLVVCGKYTVDGETGQVGPALAELLGLPQIVGARTLAVVSEAEGPARLEAERESDEGAERVVARLPALVTTAERLIQPIRPTDDAIARAATTPVETWTAADVGLAPAATGADGSPTTVLALRERRHTRPPGRLLDGEVAAQAAALADAVRAWQRGRAGVPTTRPLPPAAAPHDETRGVWVVVERRSDGAPTRATLELLGEAAWLARQLGGDAAAIVPDADPPLIDALVAHGADRVVQLRARPAAPAAAETEAAMLAALLETRTRPHTVLFSASEHGRETAPRVAARLGLGLTGDCIGLILEPDGRLLQLKPALGLGVVAPIWSRTTPQLATVRPGTFLVPAPEPGRPVRLETVEIPRPTLRTSVRGETLVEVDLAWRPLDGAPAVVGVGTGIGGPEALPLIRRFAGLFDAAIGATRRVTDRGWLPRNLQIGLTGRIVAPGLYVAVAVRGAPNHTIGIEGAGTVIALNLARDAEIFRVADVGIVGDYRPVLEQACALLGAPPQI